VGHLGNFYWLAQDGDGAASMKAAMPRLRRDIRVVLVASKGRIHFTTPNDEEAVRHVLSRVRSLR
jgi:hypothetical protein